MAGMIFWRLFRTALAVWALASGVFLLSHRHLNEALQIAQPEDALLRTDNGISAQAAQRVAEAALRQRLGLDLPLFYVGRSPRLSEATPWQWHGPRNQYHHWLRGVLQGHLGTSFRTGEAVTTRLGRALRFTLPLTGTAAALAVLLALGLAQRLAAGPSWQHPARGALVALHALPLFVVALALLLLFANPEILAWFPAYGLDQPDAAEMDFWGRWGTYGWHLALPVAALTLATVPELTLQLEASLAHELRTHYATTARAKGLAEFAVIRHHALRNALLPSLTHLAELLPALVAGAVVVEVVFAVPGMGRLLAEAAAARDYPVLVGGVLLIGAARLLALLMADLLYSWADPRIRWQS